MFYKAQRFNQLQEKVTNFAIIFKNVEGIIEEWNVGAEGLFGYTAEEAIGQSIEIIYRPEDNARVVLIVEDDGEGFVVEESANKTTGLGLIGMGERAALLNGEIEIESAKGEGTTVYVRVRAIFEEERKHK